MADVDVLSQQFMEHPLSQATDRCSPERAAPGCADTSAADDSPWSPRESELLAVTLELLREHGYDRLTVDAVAATARASKATVYRRWPTKAELVLAAFIEGTRQAAFVPDTGSLREDLLQVGAHVCEHAGEKASVFRAVMVEVSRNPALSEVMQQNFFEPHRLEMQGIFDRAVERGEIARESVTDDLWDLLPGYLVFRIVLAGRTADAETVRAVVDGVVLPGLTRRPC